ALGGGRAPHHGVAGYAVARVDPGGLHTFGAGAGRSAVLALMATWDAATLSSAAATRFSAATRSEAFCLAKTAAFAAAWASATGSPAAPGARNALVRSFMLRRRRPGRTRCRGSCAR